MQYFVNASYRSMYMADVCFMSVVVNVLGPVGMFVV